MIGRSSRWSLRSNSPHAAAIAVRGAKVPETLPAFVQEGASTATSSGESAGRACPAYCSMGSRRAPIDREEALADLARARKLKLPHFRDVFPGRFRKSVKSRRSVHLIECSTRFFAIPSSMGSRFRNAPAGHGLTKANVQNATPLFAHAPTALLFGAWDSTGSAGGSG